MGRNENTFLSNSLIYSGQAFTRLQTTQARSPGGPTQEASPPSRESPANHRSPEEAGQASRTFTKPQVKVFPLLVYSATFRYWNSLISFILNVFNGAIRKKNLKYLNKKNLNEQR